MTLTLNTREAHQAFATLASITPTKTTRPILQHIEVTADPDSPVRLRATSLDVSGSLSMTGECEGSFRALIPAKEMASLLKEIDSETVEVDVDGSRVDIRAGSGSFKLLGDDPDEFPALDFPESATTCTIPGPVLTEAIKAIIGSVADEETRFAINAVRFELSDDVLTLVATDGRSLAVYEAECNGMENAEAVIPTAAIKRVAALAAKSESVGISINKSDATFLGDSMTIRTQLQDGAYPAWRGVIPTGEAPTITLPRDELMHVVRRVSTMCDGQHLVTMRFDDDALTVLTETPSVGRAEESMALETVIDEPFEFCVNSKYLLDGLKEASAEMIPLRPPVDASVPSLWSCGPGHRFVLMGVSAH